MRIDEPLGNKDEKRRAEDEQPRTGRKAYHLNGVNLGDQNPRGESELRSEQESSVMIIFRSWDSPIKPWSKQMSDNGGAPVILLLSA
jgi:hypothetical protein